MTKSFGPQGHFHEALELFKTGRLEQSEKKCRLVLAGEPQNRDARHLLAMIRFRKGDNEAAAAQLQALVTEFPTHPPALNDLGLVLTRLGRYHDAEAALVNAINLAPDMPGYHLNLAITYKERNFLRQAEQQIRAALRLKRDYAEAFRVLSEILSMDGRGPEAVQAAGRAGMLEPANPRNLLRLAEALNLADDVARAREAYERAMAAVPDSPQIQMAYGQFLVERGFQTEAAGLMRMMLSRYPDWPGAHMILSRTITFAHYDAEMAQMEALLDRPDIDEEGKAGLHFGLAKAYEDIKDFSKAFDHSLKGNALARKKKQYAPEKTEIEFNQIRSAFSPAVIAHFGDSGFKDETPIFVLGMPRSGTSLAEQILASHPDVHGGGELTILYPLIRELQKRLGVEDAVGLTAKATSQDWQALGQAYVSHLCRLAPTARRIVNKMPDNFRFIGHIRLALPKAKVIYCRRSPPDTCISIFNLHFGPEGPLYSNDLTELGDYYRRHDELMQHWHAVAPDFFLTCQYEEMVADQEGQTRRLLDFCGLDWDDSVLNFFDTERRVRTAAAAQVRKPIYASSVGRYKRFGSALQPLLDALDWDEEKGDIRR